MRVLGRGAAIAASFVILSSPPVLQRLVGGDTRAYVLATVALAPVLFHDSADVFQPCP